MYRSWPHPLRRRADTNAVKRVRAVRNVHWTSRGVANGPALEEATAATDWGVVVRGQNGPLPDVADEIVDTKHALGSRMRPDLIGAERALGALVREIVIS